MNLNDFLTANIKKHCTLTVPVYRKDGGIAMAKGDNGEYKVMMIEPEVYRELGLTLKATLGDTPKESAELFEKYLQQGRAKLSDIPATTKQRRVLKAASSIQPYDTDWQKLDTMIRETENTKDNNEMMFMQSLGLVEDSLTWGDWELESIIREPLKLRENGRYAYTDMNPQALNDPFSTRLGNYKVPVPINYNTFVTGTRPSSATTDQINAGDASRSTIIQQNYNILYGGGGISLADPGIYWKGLLNSDQTVTLDNTLGGLYAPPGVYFNNATDIERVLKFVKSQFEDWQKYGNFAALVGRDIKHELATTISDNKTDSFTLARVMENIAQTLNDGQEFMWDTSYKIPVDSIAFFITNPMYTKFKSGGGLTVIELAGNALASNGFVYSIETFETPGNGVDTDKTIIFITGLLPTP